MKSYKEILKTELIMKNRYDGWTVRGMEEKLREIEIKEYWEDFYKSNPDLISPSSFSKFVFDHLNLKDSNYSVVDIGCGNGRDSLYFTNNNLKVTSVDNFDNLEMTSILSNYIKLDIKDFNISADLFYARFFLHAIDEDRLDGLLENISNLMSNTSHFAFETRSTKGITVEEKEVTNFKSSMGEKHFRMLYSKPYMENKLSKYFNIDYLVEENNVAKHKSDNPYVLRGIISKK